MSVPVLPERTEVLVVGAGPVGLAAAVGLAMEGVDVTVVDRQAEGANTSRAAVVHARTMEVLDSIGVAGALLERGIRTPAFTMRDRDRTLVEVGFDGLPSAYPFLVMVPQSETEAVLAERLRALGGDVARPVTVTGLTQDGASATVALADGRTIRARYVLAADGIHSTVRRLAGIGFEGDDGNEAFALADVRLAGGLPAEQVALFLSGEGTLIWAPLPGGVVRLVATVDDPPERPDRAYVQALLDARGPASAPARVDEVIWSSRFRIHHKVARTFRAGRVLLAGDAAHVHSPAGGQGMNLGLRDGVAAARAIAAVLRGAPESLLDDYDAERRPVARRVVRLARRLTRIAVAPRGLRTVRNLALRLLARIPAARRSLVWQLSGLADGPARERARPRAGSRRRLVRA